VTLVLASISYKRKQLLQALIHSTSTMTASAVAMKSALPNPQPARKPTTSPRLPEAAGSARQGTEDDDEPQPRQQGPLVTGPAGDERSKAESRQ
jgi:hypothetical protein